MYKYILAGAGNLNWMAIFALLTFLIIFLLSAIMILKKNRSYTRYMARLPLEDSISDKEQENN